MISIAEIRNISPQDVEKLQGAAITTSEMLLEKGATPQGRQMLAQATGIPRETLLLWINYVDLFRINGIRTQYANLLEAAGVDTVPELAQRNPANLYQKLTEVNAENNLVQRLPRPEDVESWVAQAKELPRIVTY